MPKTLATVFIHISKFNQDNVLKYLNSLKSWYENQNHFQLIHLSFPIFFWKQIQEEKVLFFWLTRLIRDKTFHYFPNTLSGENHQTLTGNEIEWDLAGSLSNAEGTGYVDLFGTEPIGLYISNRDLYRTKIQTLYQPYRHLLLIEGLRQDKQESFLLYLHKNQKRAIELHTPSFWNNVRQLVDCFSPLPTRQKLLYWSSLDQEPLEDFLTSLPTWLFPEAPLLQNTREAAGYLQNLLPITAEADLAIRSHCFTRQMLRPGTSLANKIQESLTTIFRPTRQPLPFPQGEPQQISEGETDLTSEGLRLSFKSGQLLGWQHLQKKLPPLPTCRSYSSGATFRESDYHSSSFEQNNLNGLRQMLFSAGNVSSSLDYFPLEREQAFLLNGFFTWSPKALARGSRLALTPLEFPLYLIGKDSRLKVTVLNTEGDHFERTFMDDDTQEILWGESFFFHHSSCPLMISFPSQRGGLKFPLSLAVRRLKGKYYLFSNLGGFTDPITIPSGDIYYQTFSVVLNQPQKSPSQPLLLPDEIKSESFPVQIWR